MFESSTIYWKNSQKINFHVINWMRMGHWGWLDYWTCQRTDTKWIVLHYYYWEDSSRLCQLQRWREAPACLPWYSLPVLFMLCWYRVWMILGKGVGYEKIITSKFDNLEPPCVDKDRWVGGWCLLSDVVALKIGYPLCSSHRMGWG